MRKEAFVKEYSKNRFIRFFQKILRVARRHRRVIVVNSKHSSTRKRFTIAHELGHYFIQNKPSHCFAHRDAGNYSLEERYANNFASTLLMPEDEIIREVGNFKKTKIGEQPDSELINYIANEFDVSQSAAAIRLKKLHII
jgi:Zn-dependent peptidase ImmA (M78 family)